MNADSSDQIREEDEASSLHERDTKQDIVLAVRSGLMTTLSEAYCPLTPVPSPQPSQIYEETAPGTAESILNPRVKLVTPESHTRLRSDTPRQHSSGSDSDNTALMPALNQRLVHLQSTSDGSSGFVHSMKTASMTNGSFSAIPRSVRIGKSTDSYNIRDSQPRYSIESDRPISRNSLDDVALKRGFKRQQIIDELISTEESYVSDLKALVYLYSTLLASTSSIPNRIRTAIERNVTSILQMHEDFLAKLHNARLQAAARRWADTKVPMRLGKRRRSHLRHSDRDIHVRNSTIHRRVRSSVDSAEAYGLHPRHSGSAEPVDVCEIASVLRSILKELYAYEEYCANFETIGHELQKHNPQLWPTYESGMESLAGVIMAIDQRQTNHRRGLTVGDLLIKPIQRLTKYPLLLEQLLTNTPVADAPAAHVELEMMLQFIRDVVQSVNLARENPYTRQEIQRRWLLLDRLDLSNLLITPQQFKSLGSVELCGVLHVAYQTSGTITGCFALCALLGEHFLVAVPSSATGKFEAMALIQLCDIRLEASMDGKGLQCASTLFTWKISFACDGHYRELVLSACSKAEEDIWTTGLRGEFSDIVYDPLNASAPVMTCTTLDLKSVGLVFSSQKSLSRESSVQRAATVGGRPSISHVIVRNTHNLVDLHEYRDPASSITPINRSQSHMNTKRIPVLEPKRSERTRLESRISDIWTKERLPFPGMVGSRGGKFIRASAGSLARKLSLASIHTPFSKGRTSSLSMASKKSYDLFNESTLTFEIRRGENDTIRKLPIKPKEVPEVDDMRSVVDRMIGANLPISKVGNISAETVIGTCRGRRNRKEPLRSLGPNDPAAAFYKNSSGALSGGGDVADAMKCTESTSVIGIEGVRRRRKRWSKSWPIDKLRELGSEAKGILYSTSSSGA